MVVIKKVVIFGATGNTGLCSLQAALDLGHDVTAFIRDIEKVPEEFRSKAWIISGDTNNISDVEKAVDGQDGVIIALGTRNDLSPTTVMSDGTRNILAAMEKFGVKRVSACVSAYLFNERSQVPERFVPLTEDHDRMLQYLKDSDREWIAVFPPHITEEPPTGNPVILHGKKPGRRISKHDLGRFLVTSLEQDEHRSMDAHTEWIRRTNRDRPPVRQWNSA